MQILFIHQNFPGQYRNLARYFADNPDWDCYAVGEKPNVKRQMGLISRNTKLLGYDSPKEAEKLLPGSSQDYANQHYRAGALAGVLLRQKKNGLSPKVICAHPGWGEGLYLREIFPEAKLIYFFEFFFRPDGPIVDFDSEFPSTFAQRANFRTKNAANFISLDQADVGICPTWWQFNTYPKEYHHKIRIIHDGIDTQIARHYPAAQLVFPRSSHPGRTYSCKDEIITFSVRNLEPSRGFHRFMRVLPRLQKVRPNAHFLIVGGDESSYVKGHESGRPWREVLLDEVGDQLDMSRTVFVGKLPYHQLLELFSITSLHLYFTIPFVLSWSMMEAMACGAPVLASSTGPVTEVIEDGVNGFLFDYFNEDELVERVDALLDDPALRQQVGNRARAFIIENYDLKTRCLPQHVALINELAEQP